MSYSVVFDGYKCSAAGRNDGDMIQSSRKMEDWKMRENTTDARMDAQI